MTGRRVKAAAVAANLILLGLTLFVASRPGFEIEGVHVLLLLMMALAPVISILALSWPHQAQAAVVPPSEAAKGQG